MFGSLSNTILDFSADLGYLGIYISMFIESGIFPPLPSELVLGTAGLLIYQGHLNLFLTAFVAALGNLTGSIFLYIVGLKGGRPFVKKYGYYFQIDDAKMQKAEIWFDKYGNIAILFCQFIPLARSFITIPAGVLRKNISKFLIYTFIGAYLWCFFILLIASSLGEEWEKLVDALDKYQMIVLVIMAISIGGFIVYKLKVKSRKSKV